MKTIEKTIEVCDCGCCYCEFSIESSFEVECPYCDGYTYQYIQVKDGQKQKIECEECEKKFRCKILFNHV